MQPEPSRLDIATEDRNVVATGVVDSHTVTNLEQELGALGVDGDVTLELGGVTFIDSSGLRIIVASHQALEDAGHRLELRNASDAVRRLLEITGLTDHLNLT